jgi:chemotaxis protein CheC
MKNYLKPISLILLAAGSLSENQRLRAALDAEEYVFASATSLYHCLALAECHHPKVVRLDFSIIENSLSPVIQLFLFLNIPLILLGENLSDNMMRYLQQTGVFAVIDKNTDARELRRAIEMAVSAKHKELNSSLDLGNFRTIQKTKLQDIVKTAIGTAVARTSEMINCEMQFEPPSFHALSPLILPEKLMQDLGEKLVAVAQLDFSGNMTGAAHMLFSQEAADAIVFSLCGAEVEGDELNQMKTDIMGEIGNVALNGIVGTFSNTLKYKLSYVIPSYIEGSTEEIFKLMNLSLKSTVILFMSHFKMLYLHVEGDFVLFFQARILLDLLFRD